MALPETIDRDWCGLSRRWLLEPDLAVKLTQMAGRLEFPIQIISGYRDPEHQRQLRYQGRPAADPDVSNHTTCPSRAADVWPGIAASRVVQARMGEAGVSVGLRWGGGSPVDPSTGIPSDWNHFDLGPRPR